ncbi:MULTISPECIES: PKD domain-containing protein [Flavobacterium]|uniref:PKD domain-containing protein n=1 Tax=Flavobacterium lipolyticum TaxID=2893754 RepID=A0ABS8LY79_9FLAO|nr:MULTISPECIES: PKD domain-containing protein [unclassified Flavobacterium]MCC9017549.1 PKD domain-containing protein [Flavobacterium sp. F-126]
MKKIASILMLALIFYTANSCSKHDDEVILDCFAEAIYVKLHNSTDATNPKLMNYSVGYSGTGTLVSVNWTFGDGTTGTGKDITHLYPAAGTYEVKAEVTVAKDGANCTSIPKRNVTIN